MQLPDDHPAHVALANCVARYAGQVVLDIGSGRGSTIAEVLRRGLDVTLIAIDRKPEALREARSRPRHDSASVLPIAADFANPLPLRDSMADLALCHNVVECVARPVDLLQEIRRALTPHGHLFLSHVDFAGLVLNSSDEELNRAVIDAHALATPRWMPTSDGYVARKMIGYARAAGFSLVDVEPIVAVDTDFLPGGLAAQRVNAIEATVRGSARIGHAGVADVELQRWIDDLETLASQGGFFFAETVYIAHLSRAK